MFIYITGMLQYFWYAGGTPYLSHLFFSPLNVFHLCMNLMIRDFKPSETSAPYHSICTAGSSALP